MTASLRPYDEARCAAPSRLGNARGTRATIRFGALVADDEGKVLIKQGSG